MDDGIKIYGMCLGRLKHQINIAKAKENHPSPENILLESYNTGDMEDIIDILELYDIEERNFDGLSTKLDELSFTVSTLLCERLFFDYTAQGELGLHLDLSLKPVVST
ncbi:MAG: hypothetical protein HQL10_12965 [Nitrospirae bacterium]|nr:hypothetical protein [Nitrospirota bacterium]